MNNLNVMFVGDLNIYGRSLYRLNSIRTLGVSVSAISYVKMAASGTIHSASIIDRVFWKFKIPFNDNYSNITIAYTLITSVKKFDIVWIEKGLHLYPWTMWFIKKISPTSKVILFTEDDACVKHSLNIWLRLNFSKFDFVVTTKKHNLVDLKIKYKVNNIILIPNTFFEEVHYKYSPTQSDILLFGADVSAIGAFEADRAEYLVYLANAGIKVSVWGTGWNLLKRQNITNLIIKDKFLFQDEYTKAINCTTINLNFLRKINFDTITSRSIEIPACGGFVLTEASLDHSSIFEMGVDADDFSSKEELKKKVIYYLNNPELVKMIANRGFNKVDKYEFKKVIKKLFEIIINEPSQNQDFIYL